MLPTWIDRVRNLGERIEMLEKGDNIEEMEQDPKQLNPDAASAQEPELEAETEKEDDTEAETESAPEAADLEENESAKAAVSNLVSLESFEDADLHPDLLTAIRALGWEKPTPVQSLCLPLTLKDRDVAGFAQTGTGKTGVFLITIANRILKQRQENPAAAGVTRPISAVILAPTRELAVQIESDAQKILAPLHIKSLAVFGGMDYDKQAQQIRDGVDIIVATPGRLKDYYQKKIANLSHVATFVCDEADRMFDMGFIEDVEFFYQRIPEKTQRLLFSATTNEEVKQLAFEYLENPEYIFANPETMTPELIEQHCIIVESKNKLKVLIGLMHEHQPVCSVIFTNTKIVAEWLHYKLQGNGIECSLITGDLPQKKRIALIHQIKEGKVKALIATDVASRGLHIANLSHVYNFDLPDEEANYVHRIGRTARAGASGAAYSLVCEDYGHNLAAIQTMLGPQIALNAVWYNPAYLSITDAAGNPYKDPNFKSSSMRRGPSSDAGKGAGARRRAEGRGGRDDGRGKSGKRPESRHTRPLDGGENRHDRGGRGRGRERDRDRDQRPQHAKGRGPQKRAHIRDGRGHDAQQRGHSQSPQNMVVAKDQNVSVFALIKRFFKAIFRWGKN